MCKKESEVILRPFAAMAQSGLVWTQWLKCKITQQHEMRSKQHWVVRCMQKWSIRLGVLGWKRAKRVGGKRKGLYLNCGASSVVMRDCV